MLKIFLVLALVAATASGQCDSGWSSFGQSCYRLLMSAQSFDAHRATCESFGGWLVSISSAEENAFVNRFPLELQQTGCGSSTCLAYIGLARNSAVQFTNWLDGTPFEFTNWNSGEPNSVDGSEKCVELIKDSGKWNDIRCSDNKMAVCEKPRPATGCDIGWAPSRQSCYVFFPGAQSFDSHRATCEGLGGWLVSISSAEENNFVNQLLQALCGSTECRAYVGLRRNSANWPDGTPFDFTNWNTGEPNNVDGTEKCVELARDSGKWNLISCGNVQLAMCEKPQPATWCATGWSLFGQCCYSLLPALQTFDEHVSNCQNSGGQLVSIRSGAENNFVQQLQQAGCSGSSCPAAYIGLRRNSAGYFTSWLDGSPFGGSFYSNWDTGEPDNVDGRAKCGEMIHGIGKWNDIPPYHDAYDLNAHYNHYDNHAHYND